MIIIIDCILTMKYILYIMHYLFIPLFPFHYPRSYNMLPTDPRLHSAIPSEQRSILYGSALGLSTVILGTKLMNTSPLNSKKKERKVIVYV